MNALPPDAGSVFEALSDPTRRQLLAWLAADGPMSATQLAGRLPLTRQGVAKHLQLMAESGVVTPDRRGREVLFSVDRERLDSASAWIAAVSARWDRRLASLQSYVQREAGGRD